MKISAQSHPKSRHNQARRALKVGCSDFGGNCALTDSVSDVQTTQARTSFTGRSKRSDQSSQQQQLGYIMIIQYIYIYGDIISNNNITKYR